MIRDEIAALQAEISKPILAMLDWLAPRVPAWAARTPSAPGWRFWLVACLIAELALRALAYMKG